MEQVGGKQGKNGRRRVVSFLSPYWPREAREVEVKAAAAVLAAADVKEEGRLADWAEVGREEVARQRWGARCERRRQLDAEAVVAGSAPSDGGLDVAEQRQGVRARARAA
jgi:hypothetical protein